MLDFHAFNRLRSLTSPETFSWKQTNILKLILACGCQCLAEFLIFNKLIFNILRHITHLNWLSLKPIRKGNDCRPKRNSR